MGANPRGELAVCGCVQGLRGVGSGVAKRGTQRPTPGDAGLMKRARTMQGTSRKKFGTAARTIATLGLLGLTVLAGGCNNAASGGLAGAGLGAGAGAIIGSLYGKAGNGAAIGAVAGALGGAIIGDQNERRDRSYGGYDRGYYGSGNSGYYSGGGGYYGGSGYCGGGGGYYYREYYSSGYGRYDGCRR